MLGKQRAVQRDNSIIERNKAKLAELAEKRKQENEEKRLEDAKKAEEAASAKPPRPFDPTRLESLSQPKPKRKDPNLKPEAKAKRVSA